MTKFQLIELIKEHHSNLPNRQMEIYIETAANKIALDTDIGKKTFLLSSVAGQRWYDLDDKMIDIMKVEILDTNDRYVMIPKLADYHKLLKGDTDETSGSLT